MKYKFEVGQQVRHRASGEVGIITDIVLGACNVHSSYDHVKLGLSYAGSKEKEVRSEIGSCEHEPTGEIKVSIGFGDAKTIICQSDTIETIYPSMSAEDQREILAACNENFIQHRLSKTDLLSCLPEMANIEDMGGRSLSVLSKSVNEMRKRSNA